MKQIFGSLFLISGICAPIGAYAQSLGYFETTPYYNNTTIVVNSQGDVAKEPAPMPKIVEKTTVKSPYLVTPLIEVTTQSKPKDKHIAAKPIVTTNKVLAKPVAKKMSKTTVKNDTDVPSHVILFCGTPAEPIAKSASMPLMSAPQNVQVVEDWHPVNAVPQTVAHNVINIPSNAKNKVGGNGIIDDLKNKTSDYKKDWDEFNRRPQSREEYAVRGPIKAIYQDTKSAIANDVPQALADHLPWVDTNRKQENFESVLDRVADNLQRAKAADPEWAYAAQNEIRELAQKLDKLPAPPQYREETIYKNYDPTREEIAVYDDYHKRPVWNGANASGAEKPQKPVALKSNN